MKMNNKKYTGISMDTGEEITGFLVIAEGTVNNGWTYICPETTSFQFVGTDEKGAPMMAIGPFYRVIPDAIMPADGEGDGEALLKRYTETGMTPAQIEDFIHVLERYGIDLPKSNAKAADELLREFAAYRKSGLSADFLNGIMETLCEHGITFRSGDPKEQVEKWLERMRWHVQKVDELAEENQRLKNELQQKTDSGNDDVRSSKVEEMKRIIHLFMAYEYKRNLDGLRRHGTPMELAAHTIYLDQAIMDVFKDAVLSIDQCEDLMTVRSTVLRNVKAELYSILDEGEKPIFGQREISDAIYAVIRDAGKERTPQ